MKHLLLLTGVGEGCDYTIGCNCVVMELDATSLRDACDEAERILDEEYGELDAPGLDGYRVEQAEVFAVSHDALININQLRADRAEAQAAALAKQKEKDERAELARLKKKYG